jgi:hypothetical protein
MQHEHSQKINNCKVERHLSDRLKTNAEKIEVYKYLKARTSCDPKRIYNLVIQRGYIPGNIICGGQDFNIFTNNAISASASLLV